MKLAYFEWSAPDDAGHDDPEAWAQANPALGIRISEESVEMERGGLEPEDFARERLGIFPEDVDTTEPAVEEADWRACTYPSGLKVRPRQADPVVFAFEVSIDRKWAVIASAGASDTIASTVHVELVDNRRRTGWVVDRLQELRDRHSPAAILANPAGPAGGLLPSCEKAGLVVGIPDGVDAKGKPKHRTITGREYAQACQAAYDDITEHRWRHFGDDAVLNTAVGGAARRTVGDAWVWDRRGAVDISPLVAVSLAAWAVGRQPPKLPALEPILIVT